MSTTQSTPPTPPVELFREALELDQAEWALAAQERGADTKLSDGLTIWGHSNELVLLKASSSRHRQESGRWRSQVSLRLEAIPHPACHFIWVRLELVLDRNPNLIIHRIAPLKSGKRQFKLSSGTQPKLDAKLGPAGLSFNGSTSTEQTIEYDSIVGSKLSNKAFWTFARNPEDKAPLSFDTMLELDVEYLPENYDYLTAVVNLSARIAFHNVIGSIPMIGRRTDQTQRLVELDRPA